MSQGEPLWHTRRLWGVPAELNVSVVMPVRNGLPHIREQLAALARQDYGGTWELIVSDNGSTDGSADAVRAAQLSVPVQVVESAHAPGVAGARSEGIKAARGRIFLFCDADDVVADDWVAVMAEALEKYPAAGGALDETALNHEEVLRYRPTATAGKLPVPFGAMPSPIGANCGLRREVYDQAGGFDVSFRKTAEETDLFWRVQLAGHELAWVPEAVVAYRHRPGVRPLLRQWYTYGRGRVRLVARYRPMGLCGDPETWRDAARTAAWVVLHSVDCIRGQTRRVCYLRILAQLMGQVQGSMECGVLHVRINAGS
jgi:glycosyltransferase involved in cell wall biosynthesis